MSDRERAWTLFGFVVCWIVWIQYDSGRVAGRRDRELARLRDGQEAGRREAAEAKAKAAGAEEANTRRIESDRTRRNWIIAVASLVAALATVLITAIAYHVI